MSFSTWFQNICILIAYFLLGQAGRKSELKVHIPFCVSVKINGGEENASPLR